VSVGVCGCGVANTDVALVETAEDKLSFCRVQNGSVAVLTEEAGRKRPRI
jgi:hypothetical protein